jgi:hypothetical protein
MEAWFFEFITYFQHVGSTYAVWTFPVPFISTPTCFGNKTLTGVYNGGSLRVYFPSTTNISGVATATEVQEQSIGVDPCIFIAGDYVFSNIRAIGRWK